MNINIRNVRLKKGEEIADWLVSLADTGDCYSSRPTVPQGLKIKITKEPTNSPKIVPCDCSCTLINCLYKGKMVICKAVQSMIKLSL